jgi:hypothetical protein
MVNGSAPPSDMSLWVFNGKMTKSHPEFTSVLPGAVTMLDGANSLCHELSLATPGLCVTVVSHPGISIDHLLVKRRDAWELLHNPPQEGDLSQLRALPYNTVAWVRGGKVPHGHRVGSDQTSQLMAMFGYEADEVQSGCCPFPSTEGIDTRRSGGEQNSDGALVQASIKPQHPSGRVHNRRHRTGRRIMPRTG